LSRCGGFGFTFRGGLLRLRGVYLLLATRDLLGDVGEGGLDFLHLVLECR